MKKSRFNFLIAIMLIIAMTFITACDLQPSNKTDNTDSTSQTDTNTGDTGTDVDTPVEPVFSYRSDYTPKKFDKSSVSYEIEEICDGFKVIKNTLTKNDGNKTVVYTLEVNLNKVNVVAGTKDNTTDKTAWTKAVPTAQATAYEEATGKTVLASLNADFFGSTAVNAFVKDGIIMKDGHNDNGNYDYTNSDSDVPASAPMLFGIKGTTAQVAPIINYTGDIKSASVKQAVIQAKLQYKLSIDGTSKLYEIKEESTPSTTSVVFNKEPTARSCNSGDLAIGLDITKGISEMTVKSVTKCTATTRFKPTQGETAYLFIKKSLTVFSDFEGLSVGKKLSMVVTSPDGLWDGYTTILGCRQSLVENSKVASTVTVENTNGAQSADVPRSAVGVKEDGTVVIFAVESMYYGKKANDGDTHGMNLPELADFMAFYGIKNGANFDGGGSTQLIIDKNGTKTVYVRSSDTGSTTLSQSRPVINTILVVEK